MTNLIRAAVVAALLPQRSSAPTPSPLPFTEPVEPDSSLMLDQVDVRPVKPGHPHEPAPKRFAMVGKVCYVRQADWPALKASLERVRAAKASPAGSNG